MKSTSSSLKSTQSKPGFTRADLLAVLGGVLLLAIAQWPLLGRSREGGHEAVCMNNLRQWGLAMFMYASENQDSVPEEGNSSLSIADYANSDAWYNTVAQFIKQRSLSNLYCTTPANPPLPQNGSVYSCPATPPLRTPGPTGIVPPYSDPPNKFFAFFMYAENGRICINKSTRNGAPNTKFGQIPKPSDTILLAENDTTTSSQPSESVTTGYYAIARHQGFGIFAMSDGQVRAARTNEFLRTSAEANSAATEWATPRKMYWYPTPTTPN